MKQRWLRLAATVWMCVLLCTSLCGCSVIDDLRAATATSPDADTVAWNGVTYKRLDENLTAQIMLHGVDYDRSVYINNDEVPILLMSLYCAEFNPTENDVFLLSTGYYDEVYTPEFSFAYFCREDRYDEVMRQLRDGLDMTGFFYQYCDTESGELCTYYFSEEECAAFRDVLSPMNRWKSRVYGSDWSTAVYPCTSDGLIGVSMYEILQDDGAYYVAYYPDTGVEYDADYDVYDESFEELTEYYRVPKEYYDLFGALLMDSVKEQAMAYEDYYEW